MFIGGGVEEEVCSGEEVGFEGGGDGEEKDDVQVCGEREGGDEVLGGGVGEGVGFAEGLEEGVVGDVFGDARVVAT